MIVQRTLGSTGLPVSSVIAGAAQWHLRDDGSGTRVEETAELVTAMLRDRVTTAIDTANAYGDGGSERRVAEVLARTGAGTAGFLVQTKAGRAPGTKDFSADRVRRSLAESMERLRLDRLPIVYLHDPEATTWEAATAGDGPVAGLLRAREEGLVGALGISGGPPELLRRFVDTGHFQALITHNRYTLVQRSADRLIRHAAAAGLAVINAAPYGGGVLTQWPRVTSRYAYGDATPAMLTAIDEIGRLCHDHGVPLAAAALQLSLCDPRITSTIVGLERLAVYQHMLELAQVRIPGELWRAIDEVPLDPAHVSPPGPATR